MSLELTNNEKEILKQKFSELDYEAIKNQSDCDKYKMFVEDNYMFEFMIWENEILPMNLANNDTNTHDSLAITD